MKTHRLGGRVQSCPQRLMLGAGSSETRQGACIAGNRGPQEMEVKPMGTHFRLKPFLMLLLSNSLCVLVSLKQLHRL